jgi:hypothetical protein
MHLLLIQSYFYLIFMLPFECNVFDLKIVW